MSPAPEPPTGHAAAAFEPGRQRSVVTVLDCDTGERRVVHASDAHLEAPNWSPDGAWLLCNGGGRLLRIPADGSGPPQPVPVQPVLDANNDHVIAPDGATIYLSANDGHLWAVAWGGGVARRVSNTPPPDAPRRHYLHGISPDGRTLAYVGLDGAGPPFRYGLYTVPVAGGPDTPVWEPGVPVDGPEYSPDGRWLYCNAEDPARAPGHAQLYRLRPDGSGREQLTHDERVNWFPHLSPDGQRLAYISYPPGTRGHPANRPVRLRLMHPDGGPARDLVALWGGQGTLNVNSWAPDSRRLAYVDYPSVAGGDARG